VCQWQNRICSTDYLEVFKLKIISSLMAFDETCPHQAVKDLDKVALFDSHEVWIDAKPFKIGD
jgi:hypothetical protein